MPISISVLTHATAFLAYAIFATSLALSGSRTWLKSILTLAAGLTALWAASVLAVEFWQFPTWLPKVLGALRDSGWYAVVLAIIYSHDTHRTLWRALLLATVSIVTLHAVLDATGINLGYVIGVKITSAISGIGVVVIGLVLIENMMRNLPPDHFWSVKYLGIGLSGILIYQLLIHIPQFLTNIPLESLIATLPLVFVLVLPLFVVTAIRSPGLAVRYHSSRKFVFHATTFIVTGVMLQGIAIASYYVHTIGGDNATVLSIVFGFVSVVGVAAILASATARSWLRTFVNENFFSYKYDYRLEWNKFIRAMSTQDEGDIFLRALRTLAELLDSHGGILWVLRDRWQQFIPVSHWSVPVEFGPLAINDPCISAFDDESCVYLELTDDKTDDPSALWRERFPASWLAVPLRYRGELIGVALLNSPRVPKKLDWEDKNLISLAALQLAAYLFQEETAQALADARQLEEFNKRFAFILHDTKNAIGQLMLLVRNVEEFGHKEEFRADMIVTLRHAVEKLQGLLVQLRGGPNLKPEKRLTTELVDFSALVSAFVGDKQKLGHNLVLRGDELPPIVGRIDKDGFLGVLDLVISNALEAVPKGSLVSVQVASSQGMAQVTVTDKGPGMTQKFIASELFRPLRTTKSKGFGIGAYQARETMRDLGGTIDVHSKVGEGTTVILTVPISTVGKEMIRA